MCVSVCVNVCVSVCVNVCVSVCVNVCVSLCQSVCFDLCQSVCISPFLSLSFLTLRRVVGVFLFDVSLWLTCLPQRGCRLLKRQVARTVPLRELLVVVHEHSEGERQRLIKSGEAHLTVSGNECME